MMPIYCRRGGDARVQHFQCHRYQPVQLRYKYDILISHDVNGQCDTRVVILMYIHIYISAI